MKLALDIGVKHYSWRQREPDFAKISRRAALLALATAAPGLKAAELSVVLTDDEVVQELNRDYRGKDKPTNVLSFPQVTAGMLKAAARDGDMVHLGDIVMAYQTVSREAKAQKKSFRGHYLHLLVHGVLHLLGHDHEVEKDAKKMEKLEVQIMAALGYDDPYLIEE